jgi:hypothetical protein
MTDVIPFLRSVLDIFPRNAIPPLAKERKAQLQPSLSFLVPTASTDNTPFLVLVSTVCCYIKMLHNLEDRMRAVRARGRAQATGTQEPFLSGFRASELDTTLSNPLRAMLKMHT